MRTLVTALVGDRNGSVAIEYVMVGTLISVFIFFSLASIGEKVKAMFESIQF
jgi:Flp pilus assembly pilin Flp